MKEVSSEDLNKLHAEIPYQWRVQSYSKSFASATCVAYVDSRDVQNLLDRVVGPENWQSMFYESAGLLFCKVGIKINGEWLWKSDTGSEGSIEKEKSLVSDSFKRACVHWGIGRFLYSLDIQYVKASEVKNNSNYPFPVDDRGQKIKDLTEYLNRNLKQAVKHDNKAPIEHLREQSVKPNNDEHLTKLKEKVEISFSSSDDLEQLAIKADKYMVTFPKDIDYKTKWFNDLFEFHKGRIKLGQQNMVDGNAIAIEASKALRIQNRTKEAIDLFDNAIVD